METITSLHSVLKDWINLMNPNNVYQTLINKMILWNSIYAKHTSMYFQLMEQEL